MTEAWSLLLPLPSWRCGSILIYYTRGRVRIHHFCKNDFTRFCRFFRIHLRNILLKPHVGVKNNFGHKIYWCLKGMDFLHDRSIKIKVDVKVECPYWMCILNVVQTHNLLSLLNAKKRIRLCVCTTFKMHIQYGHSNYKFRGQCFYIDVFMTKTKNKCLMLISWVYPNNHWFTNMDRILRDEERGRMQF